MALDAEGARRFGGRWNAPGVPMVYAAASPGLAVLEVLVHLDLPPQMIPPDYRLLAVHVPDDAPMEALDVLPDTAEACRGMGDAFLRAGLALALRVPSAIVPQETNTLLNPLHPAAVGLAIVRDDPFVFDPRLF